MANKQKPKVINKKKKVFNWNKVFYYLKSLINNEVCKEVGIKHWLTSIAIFFAAITISLVPTIVSSATTNGSVAINSSKNDLVKEAIYDYATSETSKDFQFIDGKASLINDDGSMLIHKYERTDMRFDIYNINTIGNSLTFNEQVELITKNDENIQSTLYIGSEFFSLTLVAGGTNIGMVGGSYERVQNIESLKAFLLEGVTNEVINDDKNTVLANFSVLVDEVYLSVKLKNALTQTGILAAINAGITLIMVPVMFIMTRGKNNPNRDLKFHQVMGIAFHSSLTPALLAMIVGFFFNQGFTTAAMIYIMLYGFRSMWLSMKYLRPQQY